MRHRFVCTLFVAAAALLSACAPQRIQQPISGSLTLSSTTVANGLIPDRCGCKGSGVAPEIAWSDPPSGTRSFAILMDDQDATIGHLHRRYFVHWLAFDLSPDRRELAEGTAGGSLKAGEQLGRNDVGTQGYAGPCPKAGSTHHYAITVYALDTRLGFPDTADGRQVLSAIDGHILARGQILGTYSH